MSIKIQTFLCFIAATLLLTLYQSGLLWLNFSPESQIQEAQVAFLADQLGELVENNDQTKINRLIDQYPFAVIITDEERDPVTSNLSPKNNQRILSAKEALQSRTYRGPIRLSNGQGSIFYQVKGGSFLPQLLWPTVASLFFGGVFAFYFWAVNEKIMMKDTTIAELSAMNNLHPTHKYKTQIADLERRNQYLTEKNQQLSYQIHQQEQQIATFKNHPDSDSHHEPKVVAVDTTKPQTDKLRHDLRRTQDTLLTLEQLHEHLKIKYEDTQKHTRQLQQNLKEKTESLHKAEQDYLNSEKSAGEKNRKIAQLEEQLLDTEPLQAEVQLLRKSNQSLSVKQQRWEKEEEKYLNLIAEKDESINNKDVKLADQKEKIKDLSVSLKKHIEMIQCLPENLQDAQQTISALIDQKDELEHENGVLRLELATKVSEINMLKRDIEDKQRRLLEYNQQLLTAERDTDNLIQELKRLSETLSQKMEEITMVNTNHDEIQQNLQKMILERDQDKQALSDVQDQLQLSHLKNQQLTFDKETLQEQVDKFEAAQYEFKLQQLSRSLQMMHADQQKKQEQVKRLTEQARYAVQLGERLKQESERKDERLEHLQHELQKAQSRISMLKKKLRAKEQYELTLEEDNTENSV